MLQHIHRNNNLLISWVSRQQMLKSRSDLGTTLTCVCCLFCLWWQPCQSDPHCGPCRSKRPHGGAAYGDKKSSEETSYTGCYRENKTSCQYNMLLQHWGSSFFGKIHVALLCTRLLNAQIITSNTVPFTEDHRILARNTISFDLLLFNQQAAKLISITQQTINEKEWIVEKLLVECGLLVVINELQDILF